MAFGSTHPLQILITAGLVVYSLAKNKLTPDGIVAAVVTAFIHMLHPWSVFFYLLVTFFGAGTVATKVHHHKKALLTQSSTGGSGGEATHSRSGTQVLANSLPASILILLHLYSMSGRNQSLFESVANMFRSSHETSISDLLPIGIIASYAAATADTLSSEMGILSPTSPFLITQPWRKVPPGTNGGVTVTGLLWGLFGGVLIALTSALLVPTTLPFSLLDFILLVSFSGLFGSVLDSVLGALVQATVEDKSSGRVVEGENGKRVLVTVGGSRVQRGVDLLNNNGVNFAMAFGTGLLTMGVSWALLGGR